MNLLKTILSITLVFGLTLLAVGCSDDGATSGTTLASATITSTGSIATSSVSPSTPKQPVTTPTSPTTPSTGAIVPTDEQVKPDLVGAYLVVIDHLIANRIVRFPEFKYLAVDTTKLPDFTPDDKTRLFKGLEKYEFQLLDKTFKQLEVEGYIGKYRVFTNGVLISLSDIRMDGQVMTLDAGIHLGGLNAYGLEDMRISYVGTRWEITKINMTWVA